MCRRIPDASRFRHRRRLQTNAAISDNRRHDLDDCGRCFNVCSRAVMHLYSLDDAVEILGARDAEGDDVAGELNRMITVLDRCAAALAAQSAPSSARRTDRRPVAAYRVAT